MTLHLSYISLIILSLRVFSRFALVVALRAHPTLKRLLCRLWKELQGRLSNGHATALRWVQNGSMALMLSTALSMALTQPGHHHGCHTQTNVTLIYTTLRVGTILVVMVTKIFPLMTSQVPQAVWEIRPCDH